MNNKKYIPGFDWVKVLGSTLVAASHFWINTWAKSTVSSSVIAMFQMTVPIFFLISGYLLYMSISKTKEPLKYTKNYIIKYAKIYVVLCLIGYAIQYTEIYRDTGIFLYKDLIFVLCTMPLNWGIMYQLWFMPPLLVGAFINTHVYTREKERVAGVLFSLVAITGIMLLAYGELLPRIPILETLMGWRYFWYIYVCYRFIQQGGFLVWIGMWFAKYGIDFLKKHLKFILASACIVSAIEVYILLRHIDPKNPYIIFNFSTIIWTIIIFYFILQVKNEKLKSHHKFVTLYSGITYFLHPLEQKFLYIWMDNGVVMFLISMIANVLAANVLTKKIEGAKSGL